MSRFFYLWKCLSVLFLCLGVLASADGQSSVIDSLKKELKQAGTTDVRVDIRLALAGQLKGKDDKLALQYADQAHSDAEAAGYAKGMAEALRTKGNILYYQGKHREAIPFFEQAQMIYRELDDLWKLSAVINDLGLMHFYLGDLHAAVSHFTESLEIDELRKDTAGMTAGYTNLAMLMEKQGRLEEGAGYLEKAMMLDSLTGQWAYYLEDLGNLSTFYKALQRYDDALSCALRGFSFADSTGAEAAAYQLASVIGDTYQSLGNLESADQYLRLSLAKAREVGKADVISAAYGRMQKNYRKMGRLDESVEAFDSALVYASPLLQPQLYNNIGELYLQDLNDPQKAEACFQTALDLAEKVGEPALLSLPALNMGLLLHQEGRNQEAAEFLDQSLATRGDLPLTFDLHRQAATIYADAGQVEKGFQFLLKGSFLQDSLLKVKEQAQARLLSFETEIRELKIREKSRQLRQRNLGLLALATGLLFTSILAWQWWRLARIQREKREQVALLSAEMHHRIRNNLATFSGIINIKGNTISDEKARLVLDSIGARILALEKVHSLFYKDENMVQTQLKGFLQFLSGELIALNQPDDHLVDVQCRIKGMDRKIDASEAIELGKLLNEVITNAFKYAVVDNPSPRIEILANSTREGLILEIRNNGNLLPEPFNIDQLGSFGLKWVKGICESMGWSYHFSNRDGEVVFHFDIPFKLAAS
jgi:two-component sensor histidine kinase